MFKDKFLKKVIELPRIYWIYLAVILVAEVAVLVMRPEKPGLYIYNAQFAPFILALPFLIAKAVRTNFRRWLYTYSILAFLSLAIDYNTYSNNGAGHAGTIQLALTFLPVCLFWLILFARWNVRRIREFDSRRALLLSAIAWGLYAFAFPPLPLGPAALLILVPWFLVLTRFGRNQAIFATFWSSMLYNTINYYWIYNVMNVETAPSGLIFLGVVLLIAYFSVYTVLAGYVFTLAKDIRIKGHRLLLLLYPLFYAGLEMTRTRGDFSFPWSHLGYVFGNHLELLQMLSYIGIFGYTILVIASNMAVAWAIEKNSRKAKIAFATPAIIFILLLVHGSYVLSKPEAQPFRLDDESASPNIAMVQPSIKQGEKWSKERFDSITHKTFGMINDSVKEGANLIVLAETAIPDHIRRQPGIIRQFHQVADSLNANVLTGALDYQRNKPGSLRRYDIYNAGFTFTPNDEGFPQRYIKKHLVPFSERIPFDDIFPILNYVDLGEGDFVPGKETPVYPPYDWTPYICYDAIFGDLVREAVRAGSRLMVNITNDGWFGRSTAPYQHLNLVRYRAIENGMPVVRLANSGVSAFIDQYGHFDGNTGIFVDAVIQRKMQLKSRNTLYTEIGDSVETALLWIFLIYLIACLALYGFNRRKGLQEK